MVYVIILLLYLAALIFVGKLASRGVSSSDDWAVAGPWSLVQRGFIFYDGIECGIFYRVYGVLLSVRMGRLVELGRNLNLYDTVCRIFCSPSQAVWRCHNFRFPGQTVWKGPWGDSRSSNFIFNRSVYHGPAGCIGLHY